jgi:hypothetical protein
LCDYAKMKKGIVELWKSLWNLNGELSHVFVVFLVCIVLALSIYIGISPLLLPQLVHLDKVGMTLKESDTYNAENQIVHTNQVRQKKERGEGEGILIKKDGGVSNTKKTSVSLDEFKKRPQFVVLAFDGSRSLAMWDRTLNFAQDMKNKGYPVHYTYFLNAVYFLDPAHYHLFKAPHQKVGVSNIGFATSKTDVVARINQVNRAIRDGHDIGSHNAGHFEGSKWSADEWLGQLSLFDSIMFNLSALDPEYHLDLKKENMVGFRAPELGVNTHLFESLKKEGYTYDTSKVGKPDVWPKRDIYGLWQFALPTILVKDMHTKKRRYTIGMDYNFYVMQSGAKDTLKKGTTAWSDAYESVMTGYREYFYKNYNGNHAPVYVANHFSYWNDGLYWEVMRDFAIEVCQLPQVKCTSFKELELYMESVE